MTDPRRPRSTRPRPRPRRGGRCLSTRPIARARDEEWVDPPVRPRRDACGRATRGSGRRSRSASAGSTRPTALRGPHPGHRGLRRRRRSRRASRRPSSPAWAAAASPRTCSTGRSAAQEGYLALRILDSTDPAYVSATVDDLDPLQTLTIVASKSGTTTEPNAFLADAWHRADQALEAAAAATTSTRPLAGSSPPSPTRARASTRSPTTTTSGRSSSTRPTSAGGTRALTYVGLVPASLIGLDLDALLASASTMLGACRTAGTGGQPGRRPGPGPGDPGHRPVATS